MAEASDRTPGERRVDLALVALLLGLAVVGALTTPGLPTPVRALTVAVGVLQVAPVPLRRTRPRTALLLFAVASAAGYGLQLPASSYGWPVLAFALLRRGRPALRLLSATLLGSCLLAGGVAALLGGLDPPTALGFGTGLLIALAPQAAVGAALGIASRIASSRAADARAQEVAARTADALADERARIADELASGVVGGLRRIAGHAAALRERLGPAGVDPAPGAGDGPVSARPTSGPAPGTPVVDGELTALRDEARQVLSGMRRVLTALREPAHPPADADSGSPGVDRGPSPARLLPAPTTGGVALVGVLAAATVALDAVVRPLAVAPTGELTVDRLLPLTLIAVDRPWTLLLLALQLLPLAWWRSAPVAALVVSTLGAIGSGVLGSTHLVVELSWSVLVYAAASGAPALASGAATAVCAAALALAYALSGYWETRFPTAPGEIAGSFALVPVLWVVGVAVRRVRLRRAARHRAAEAGLTRDAVTAERHRIARELHDVVAHHVSAIAVQAGAARLGGPQVLREAVGHIEESGRLVGEAVPALVRLTPAPDDVVALTAEGVTALAAPVHRAGVPVTVAVHGDPAGDGDAELFAQRILTEALTNVVRHAGPTGARVEVHHDTDAVRVSVVDGGPGTGPPRNGARRLRGAGLGLVGMRERAALLGGEVDAGPERGGWAVRARLPRQGPAGPGLLLEEETAR